MTSSTGVIAQAIAWIEQDPDTETRTELHDLVDAATAGSSDALHELHDRFDTRLAFGTAGLRGVIAAGPNRMNRVLVAQAARGLADFLLARGGQTRPSVVIGYDGRKNSAVFARDTAELMAGAGVKAILLPRLLPTPVLAFAVRFLSASAGVMVTASHNPANDNGYKVYLGDADAGSQIVPPADEEIAACILRAASGNVLEFARSEDFETASETVVDAYIAETSAIVTGPESPLAVTYTAMHGVGWETVSRVIDAAGLRMPALVPAQIEPDPTFPTVAFPNPEEPGALDLAFETARATGSELVIANDPDADRLAIGIPDSSEAEQFRRLSGNEVGALLGWRAAELATSVAREHSSDGVLVCSIVSAPALRAVADAYGLGFAETLTGFKWVSRVPGILFGFEEALGYLVNPQTVRDKDGISAAIAFLDLAGSLKREGLTIADQLVRFAERFGYFASAQISQRVTDLARIDTVMSGLRREPPKQIAGLTVERVDDLIDGFGELPPSDVLRIRLSGGARVVIRPSGTEPKLKVYIDTSSADGTFAQRREAAEGELERIRAGVSELLGV